MSAIKTFDAWLAGVAASFKDEATTVWQEFAAALKGTWASISPEVASLAKTAVPAAVEAGAMILSGGGSFAAVGEVVGKELLAAAATAETNILPGALTTLANEAVSQILVHPAVVSSQVAQTTIASAPPAVNQAAAITAAITPPAA